MSQHCKHTRASATGLRHWHRQWTFCPEISSVWLQKMLMAGSVICWDQREERSEEPEPSFYLCCLRPVKCRPLQGSWQESMVSQETGTINEIMLKNRIIFQISTWYSLSFPFYVSQEPPTHRNQNNKNQKNCIHFRFLFLSNYGLNDSTIHYRKGEKQH